MKKKILTLSMMLAMFFVLASCDILSTIMAAKGLYDEMQVYQPVYEDATQYTILTETAITISDTDIEGAEDMDTRVYIMLDKESPFLYVEQRLDGVEKTSIYEDAEDLYVEYLIEDMLVTPTIPEGEQHFEGNTNSNIFNSNFDFQNDVQNENKTGDHTYSFDVFLNRAVNLEALGDFVDSIALFEGDMTAFDNALAHVEMSFTETDYVIDVQVSLTDYTITFDDDSYLTMTLTSHIVTSVPEDFQMPNIFAAPYQMMPVDNILLARRTYVPDEVISFPAAAGLTGYVKLNLTPGLYEVTSTHMTDFTYILYDDAQQVIDVSNGDFLVESEAVYYLYLTIYGDFASDITVAMIEDHSPITTTEPVTTQTPTTTTTS